MLEKPRLSVSLGLVGSTPLPLWGKVRADLIIKWGFIAFTCFDTPPVLPLDRREREHNTGNNPVSVICVVCGKFTDV